MSRKSSAKNSITSLRELINEIQERGSDNIRLVDNFRDFVIEKLARNEITNLDNIITIRNKVSEAQLRNNMSDSFSKIFLIIDIMILKLNNLISNDSAIGMIECLDSTEPIHHDATELDMSRRLQSQTEIFVQLISLNNLNGSNENNKKKYRQNGIKKIKKKIMKETTNNNINNCHWNTVQLPQNEPLEYICNNKIGNAKLDNVVIGPGRNQIETKLPKIVPIKMVSKNRQNYSKNPNNIIKECSSDNIKNTPMDAGKLSQNKREKVCSNVIENINSNGFIISQDLDLMETHVSNVLPIKILAKNTNMKRRPKAVSRINKKRRK